MAIIFRGYSTRTKTLTWWFPSSLSAKSLTRRKHNTRTKSFIKVQGAELSLLTIASTRPLVQALYRYRTSDLSGNAHNKETDSRTISHSESDFEVVGLDVGGSFVDLHDLGDDMLKADDPSCSPPTTVYETDISGIEDDFSFATVEDYVYVSKASDNFATDEAELEFGFLVMDEKNPYKFSTESLRDAGNLPLDEINIIEVHKHLSERLLFGDDMSSWRNESGGSGRRLNFERRPSSLRVEL